MADKISQAEFLKRLREQAPELKDIPDDILMKKMIERRPTLTGQVETSQEVSKRQSGHLVDPDWWKNHPSLEALTRGTTGTFPGVGAITGGMIATPATWGLGTMTGGILGGMAGKGLEDLANQGLGLSNTSPIQKTGNMIKEGALAAAVPAAIEGIRDIPGATRYMAGRAGDVIEGMTPPWLLDKAVPKYLNPDFLRSFEQNALKKTADTGMGQLNRPTWQTGPYSMKDMGNVPPKPGVKPTWMEGEFTEAPSSMTATIKPRQPGTGLQTVEPQPNMGVEDIGYPKLPGSKGYTGPDTLGNQKSIGTTNVGPQTYVEPKQLKSEFEVTTQPIIYHSPKNPGHLRGSLDGGKTWRYSTDYGENWTDYEPTGMK